MSTWVFDCEVYSNYFLALFKSVKTGEVRRFQMSPNVKLCRSDLKRFLERHTLVGFNSRNYDIPVLALAVAGKSTEEIKYASDQIIQHGVWASEVLESHGLEPPEWDSVDLIEVAPLSASLKIYGGRMHCLKLQDLPIDPHSEITAETAKLLVKYCENDLDLTIMLLKELEGQIKLREQLSTEYSIDLRSKSDAQIAEAVICAEVAKIIGFRPKRPEGLKKKVKYDVPDNISFETPRLCMLLDEIRNTEFRLNDNGSVLMPDCLDTAIRIGNGSYRLGIGGLHSSEKSCFHIADSENLLVDIDVNSYYPSIILNQHLYPMHMGPAFLIIYRKIVEERLCAKGKVGKIKKELASLRAQLKELEHDE